MKSALVALVLVACGGSGGGGGDGGGDDGSGTDPVLVAGGGATGSPIAGAVNVYVIAGDTGSPIAGATVHIASDATTDSTGLAKITDASLTGKVTVSATASGYVAASWIGVDSTSVTIPLQPAHAVPTAHVTGSLHLPSPSLGNYTLGVVLYSFLDDPSAPENSIAQPSSGGQPKNACVSTLGSSDCTWELTARVGKQVHTAIIVEGDPHGTNSDTSDDTYTLKSIAVGSPVTLTAGQNMTGETFTTISATTQIPITFPSAAPGLPYTIAIPELALGETGRIVFPLPTITHSGSATVLAPTGQFAGHYEVVALATPSATAKAPFSSAFAHNVSGSATLPAWLPAPSPSFNGGAFSFAAVSGAAFYAVQLTHSGSPVWNITVLDGQGFTLPTLTADPLPSGTIAYSVGATDVPGFDPRHFKIDDVTANLARSSGASGSFSH